MTGVSTVSPEVAEYLAAVRRSLADLPAAERDDLVAEVEASLAEAAAESSSPLAARLGAPENFAAELRSAAGLHETAVQDQTPSELARRTRALMDRFAGHPRVASLRRLVTELAPIWWVARAYLAVGVVAYALDADWSTRYPIVPRIGSAELGLTVIAVAVVVSVVVGSWMRRRGSPFPRLTVLVNSALALAVIPVALAVTDTRAYDLLVPRTDAPVPVPQPTIGLTSNGQPVENIYPFSRDGRLLHDVLLYDGRGRPIEIPTNRALDPDRRVVVTNGNRPLFNAFPIRYYEPGTRRVTRPNAAPYIELPLVLTPPLPARGD